MSTTSSVWNPDNIRDVAESIGLNALPPEVVDHLTRDVEFRIAQVLEEALKFMRHSKRTVLHTQDVSQALRVLDVEPLYGYESTRSLRFGEASIGPGQPLFYLEDEEVDFEKLINAPLPKVPREMTFTAHWLAVEGVQPSIPQNPTSAETQRQTEQNGLSLVPKGTGPSTTAGGASGSSLMAATAGADNLSVKPLVKHILSKELQHYFSHVTAALLTSPANPTSTSPTNIGLLLTENDESSLRSAAFNSIRSDPGLHQLVPYFVQFAAEKVTHNLKSVFVLTQMLHLVAALLDNPNLHVTPYVSALVPPVLTCLVGKRLGSTTPQNAAAGMTNGTGVSVATALLPEHYQLRRLASSVLQSLTRPAFVAATPTLKPRLARTLLKTLLAPTTQPLGVYYGTILGLTHIAGAEGVRALLLPNVKAALEEVLKGANEAAGDDVTPVRRREAQEVVGAVLAAVESLAKEEVRKGDDGDDEMDLGEDGSTREKLAERLGEVVGNALADSGRRDLTSVVLAEDKLEGLL